jgi:hypothetical protein
MTGAAMGGFDATQVAALAPAAMGGLGADQMGGMTTDAIVGLVADQMGGLTKDALGGISTDQFAALSGDALGGLKSENLGGLGADVIGNMSVDDLANLDPAEVQGMADIAKLVTNLNAFSVDTDTVAALLPDGWTIDSTGDMTAPPGAEINFKELPKAPPPAAGEPAIAALPDLSSNLALGAGSGAPSVLDGMDNALVSAGVTGFDFKQNSAGILNIGDGTGGAPVAAFIPDAANMTQAAADADPGVSLDPKTGGYIIVTDQGYQIPLKPSVSNPAEVASLVGSDSKVSLGSSGEITIEAPPSADGTVTAIAGIASPLLTTDERPAGTYTDGTGVDAVLTIVYADGSAQTLLPAIKDQSEFEASATAIGVTDLSFRVDGAVALTYEGVPLTLKPLFDVVKGVPGAEVTPGISNEDGKFFFTSANGDKQEFAAGS